MTYSAEFRCFKGCAGQLAGDAGDLHVPTCGGLLEVVHDLDALKKRSGPAWTKLFDERYRQNTLAVRLGRLGQARVGDAERQRTSDIVVHVRGRHEPVLGRPLRYARSARTVSG